MSTRTQNGIHICGSEDTVPYLKLVTLNLEPTVSTPILSLFITKTCFLNINFNVTNIHVFISGFQTFLAKSDFYHLFMNCKDM